MNVKVVFENEFFVVADKEAMVLSTPSRDGGSDPRPCLGLALQAQRGQQIYPVHRLDFEVSGLVLYAKTAKAHSQANTWFEKKDVFKTYHALSEVSETATVPTSGQEFVWKSLLLRGKRRTYEHAVGKPSETHAMYRGPVPAQPAWHQWELHPLTGRPHQLRYELFRHGFPIVGDALYGAKFGYSKPGIALRAVKIDFRQAPGADGLGLPSEIVVPGLY